MLFSSPLPKFCGDRFSTSGYVHSQPAKCSWMLKDTLQRILLPLSHLDSSVNHIFREANTLIDSLASFDSHIQSLASYYSLNSLPLRSRQLFLCDTQNIPSSDDINKILFDKKKKESIKFLIKSSLPIVIADKKSKMTKILFNFTIMIKLIDNSIFLYVFSPLANIIECHKDDWIHIYLDVLLERRSSNLFLSLFS